MNGVATSQSPGIASGVALPIDRFGGLSLRLDLGRGSRRGVVKDNFDVAGFATMAGSAGFADAEPKSRNAEVVDRLIASEMHVIGRARMHELAYGVTGVNDWSGTPINPRFPDRIPGGSSSGCAVAVAGGLADFALGTDTGGSIRVPAACCGVVGLKPSFGLVSRAGVVPVQSSLDCIGVIARDVATIATVMAAVAPDFALSKAATSRLGIVDVEVESDVGSAFDVAVAKLNISSQRIAFRGWNDAFEAGLTIIGAEMWDEFGGDSARLARFGDDVRNRLLAAQTISPEDVARAESVRTAFRAEVDHALETIDALVLPTLPFVPPLLGEVADSARMLRLTALVRPFNLSGHPAITLPIRTDDGLPAGVQLVGRIGEDARLCAIARDIEHALLPCSGVST